MKRFLIISLFLIIPSCLYSYWQDSRLESSPPSQQQSLTQPLPLLDIPPIAKVSPDLDDLPNLKGMGHISDLRIAAAYDKRLRQILKSYRELDRQNLSRIFDMTFALLHRWMRVDNIPDQEMAGKLPHKMVGILSRYSGLDELTTADNDVTAIRLYQTFNDFYFSAVQNLLLQTVFSRLQNFGNSYIVTHQRFVQPSEINFPALIEELKTFNLRDPLLMYNVCQILNSLHHSNKIDLNTYKAGIIDLLNANGLGYMEDGILQKRYTAAVAINGYPRRELVLQEY